jgi:hypothetical protein
MAAMKAGTRNGSVTLLNPQPPVARMLDLLCAEEMVSIRCWAARETHPGISPDGGLTAGNGADPSPFGSSKIYFPNGRVSRTAPPACRPGGFAPVVAGMGLSAPHEADPGECHGQ